MGIIWGKDGADAKTSYNSVIIRYSAPLLFFMSLGQIFFRGEILSLMKIFLPPPLLKMKSTLDEKNPGHVSDSCTIFRLHNPELDDAENMEIFSKCNNTHGHNYVLEVTIGGQPER